mmetsp:Transcript_2782/g.7467  ORF Transcript_2782/g.7467 Transcript_2782/m.7467 type:complete len:436 (-) Transcript_2782:119-1426(-)
MQSSSPSAGNDLMYSIKAWDTAVSRSGSDQLRVDDFELGRTIGKGRFARVRLVKLKKNKDIPLCLKVLKKTEVHRLDQVAHIINEKDVLGSARHPFIIQMLQTFSDAGHLYMALELVNGGELFTLLRSQRLFKLPMTVFYIAELVSALQHLHEMLIVYRDIKPENILIHRSGHLKLTDFGFAKYIKTDKTYTICGTAAYMAPEIIRNSGKSGYGLMVDWWSVGILTFELLSGRPPFDDNEEEEIYKMILKGHAQYPPVMDKVARDFIMRLLTPDPMRRLGSPDCGISIRQHKFFNNIAWDDVDAGRLEPPWTPGISGDIFDTSLFERFEESAGGAGGIGSCTASQFLAQGDADPFTKWNEVKNIRTEALAAAQEKEERRQKREEEKKAAQRAEAADIERINKERNQKRLAELEPVKVEEKPKVKQSQACCSCSLQ